MLNKIKCRIDRKLRSFSSQTGPLGKQPKDQVRELFDEDFYLEQLKDNHDGSDLVTHFLTTGWKNRLNPHPFFDIDYYLSQSPDVLKKGLNPLLHYLNWGAFEKRNPHPLFHTSFYLTQSPDVLKKGLNPLLHYLNWGAFEKRNPHPLFDSSFYLTLSQGLLRQGVNPLYHYLTCGAYDGHNPHALFDSSFYLNTYPDVAAKQLNPLSHFVLNGCKEGRSPHPLFHTQSYKEILFGEDYYLEQLKDNHDGSNLVTHFLTTGWKDRLNPHPLFDIDYYLSQSPDVLEKDLNPLLHYLNWGALEKRNPHPLFDSSFYLNTYPDVAAEQLNPLIHFLLHGCNEGRSPHPLFHTQFYKETYLQKSDENPLLNYIQHPDRNPNPWFNTKYYLQKNPLISQEGFNPLIHYLYGINISSPIRNDVFGEKQSDVAGLTVDSKSNKTLLYIASHDASRTGAPAIILNLARYYAQMEKFEIVIFMLKGGPLLDEFRQLGFVINIEEISAFYPNDTVIERIIKFYSKDQPALAIVNSVESKYFTNMFAKNQIPVLTLIHEFVTFYKKNLIKRLINNSQKIIFPSKVIKDVALDNFEIAEGAYNVIPQGLLNHEFGKMDIAPARKSTRKELNLPENAFVVLCCGAGHIRKGIDFFVQVAAHYSRSFGSNDVYFVWLGEPEKGSMFAYYLQRDIERLGVKDRLIFAGDRENVEPFFLGADVFFLSSREDPFPCVIHEAMAASLPIVVFDNSGGAAEAISNSGIVVPYADFAAAADAIFKLYLNVDLRRRLGAMALQRVRDHYDFNRYCLRITKVIQEEMSINLGVQIPEHAENKVFMKRQPSVEERRKYYEFFNISEKIKYEANKEFKPTFIAGTTRSGTSIMKLGLRMVYGSVDANEGHLWPLYKDIWEATEHYLDKYKENLKRPTSLGLTGRESLQKALFNVFHEIHMGGSDGKMFIDKSPNLHLIKALPQIQSLYPRMRIIYLKRHGISNIESKTRKFPDVCFEHHCKNWTDSMEGWLNIRDKIDNWLEVDQAHLRLNPKECTDAVSEFLSLDVGQRDVLYDTFSTREIEQTSKCKRLNTLLNETTWDERQKDTFDKICGSTMKKYNYSY